MGTKLKPLWSLTKHYEVEKISSKLHQTKIHDTGFHQLAKLTNIKNNTSQSEDQISIQKGN